MNQRLLLGIDLGGTDIKGGIVKDDGSLVLSRSIATESGGGAAHVIARIGDVIAELLTAANVNLAAIKGVGIGIPGMIDSTSGTVIYSNNLKWDNVPVVAMLKERFGTDFAITNDANAAALGEAVFGAGKGYRDSIMVTLGTGVGSGIVIGGRLFEGNRSAGAEVGHMIIKADGAPCTCGASGCLEAYASATALIKATRLALKTHPDSQMWQAITSLDEVNAKLPWDYVDSDELAGQLVDSYLGYLAVGIANMINIFRPESIILGGGISRQGDNLVRRLQPKVAPLVYGGQLGPKVDIVIAKLRNDAGFYGAAALLRDMG